MFFEKLIWLSNIFRIMQSSPFPRSVHALTVCLIIFPVFVLTIKGWISSLLLLTCLISLYVLWIKRKELKESAEFSVYKPKDIHLLSATLAMPVIAIGLGQVFRHELILRDYDGPMRLALAIPILIAAVKINFPVKIMNYLIQFSIPATLFITLLVLFISPDKKWGVERLTTYFVDPLSFGSMCLAFALITLASIDLFGKDSWGLRVWKLLAIFAGIYLSIRSGSRTGWLGLPVVLSLLFLFKVRRTSHFYLAKSLIFFVISAGMLVMSYSFIPVIHERVDLAFHDLAAYHWIGANADTSVGMRISFIRMAWFYFINNPLGGWGDQGFKALIDAPEISAFASESARNFAYNFGFHNEVATNMVRSGIWGLFASVAIFVAPMIFFIKYLRVGLEQQKAFALIGMCYVLPTFISSMTTEVLNLKFTASFYALLLAVIIGSILHLEFKKGGIDEI